MDTGVLIVGAGPTGLMMANQLARRGIRIRFIDRNVRAAREINLRCENRRSSAFITCRLRRSETILYN
jgi:2-polyprenyl-6-methoxyphenol hydroxylase-like FAD-dependent oxidoreductase